MRGFCIFLVAMFMVGAVVVLIPAWFVWGMADFDCADGYIECRRSWFSEFGLFVAVIVIVWTAAAVWLFKTRKKG